MRAECHTNRRKERSCAGSLRALEMRSSMQRVSIMMLPLAVAVAVAAVGFYVRIYVESDRAVLLARGSDHAAANQT